MGVILDGGIGMRLFLGEGCCSREFSVTAQEAVGVSGSSRAMLGWDLADNHFRPSLNPFLCSA